MKTKGKLLLAVAALLAAKIMMPFPNTDVARLTPVETLVVSVEREQIVLDSGKDRGMGPTWAAAVQDLRQGVSGVAFLGTAEHLVLCGRAERLLPEVAESGILRPAAMVCLCPGEPPDPETAGTYLSARRKGVPLQQIRAKLLRGEPLELPVLLQTKGGLRIYGP